MINEKNRHLRKILFWTLQVLAFGMFAQAPSLINYQGSARLQNGIPLGNRTISIKFDIHEGSAGGSIVASETQVVQTNLLGLFTTQIGKTTNISSLNWATNAMHLEVSIDTTGGSNYLSLGTQQMVSTPYALHAQSVPASYVGNTLTIGSNSFALTPTIVATPNTSITVSGLGTVTSVGTNTFDINIPAPTFTGLGTATVSGAYPNYTVSSDVPTFTNTNQPIIIGAYPNFTVNTPTVSAVPDQTITGSGLVNVTNPATNSFVVDVQSPTFTNANQNIITGTWPNYSVNTPTIPVTPSVSAAGIVTVSASGPNYVVGVPSPTFTSMGTATVTGAYPHYTVSSDVPTFTNSNQPIIVGTYPNFTVNTPTVSAVPDQTITGAGLANVSNPASNSFVVTVPVQSLSIGSGSISIIGSNSVLLPTTPTVSAAGIATVSAGPNYVVGVPAQSLSIGSGSIGIIGSNSVLLPTTPTVSAAGIATVSPGPNYTVGVPAPTLGLSSGSITITGGTGVLLPTTPSVSAAGAATVSAGPNYTVGVPATSIALTATAAAGPSVSATGTNSFNINIPPQTSDWSLTGNSGTNPLSNYIGTSDNQPLKFRVFNVASGNIDNVLKNAFFGYQSGLSSTTGSLSTAIGSEALFSNSTGNSNVAAGYQTLRLNSTGSGNTAIGNRALSSNTNGNGNAAVGSDAMLSNTTGIFNSAMGLNALRGNTSGDGNSAYGRDALYNNSAGSNNVAIGYQAGFNSTGSTNVFIGSTAGYNETGSNKLHIANSSNPLIYGDFATGRVGINTTTLGAYNLNIHDGSTSSAIRMTNGSTTGLGFVIGHNSTNVSILNYDNTPIYLGSNGANKMMVTSTGVAIGVTAPTATFQVNGTTRLIDGTEGAGKVLTSDALGNATWQTPAASGWASIGNAGTNPSSNYIGTSDAQDLSIRTNGTEHIRIYQATGNVGIGTTSAPGAALSVENNSLTSRNGLDVLNARDEVGAGMPVWIQGVTNGQTYGGNTHGRLLRLTNVTQARDYDMGIGSTGNFFLTNVNNYNTPAININTTGQVGIGTQNPGINAGAARYLSVSATTLYATSMAAIELEGGSLALGTPVGRIDFNAANNTALSNNIARIAAHRGGSNSQGALVFSTSDASLTERMRVDEYGRVGIGNASPGATLDINGNIKITDGSQGAGKVLTSNAAGLASWQTPSSSGWASLGNAGTTAGTNFIGTTDAQDVVFKSNNIEVFRAQSAGVLRMLSGADRTITMQGQTSNIDANNLMVRGSDAGTGAQARYGGAVILQGGDGYNQSNTIHFGGSVIIRPGKNIYGAASYNSGNIIFQNVNSANAYVEAGRVDPNGNFGLGINLPTAKLHVNGTTRLVDGTQGAGKVLTSDASGNATWQTPAATSRVRSIAIDAGMMDGFGALPATKVVTSSYSRAYLNFPDGTYTMMSDMVPIPKDWNGTSNMTVTVMYSSPSNTGNFSFTGGYWYMTLNMDILGSSVSGGSGILPPSSTVEGLMEYSFVASGATASARILNVLLQRNNDGNDSSTSGMHVWGYRIDYYD